MPLELPQGSAGDTGLLAVRIPRDTSEEGLACIMVAKGASLVDPRVSGREAGEE